MGLPQGDTPTLWDFLREAEELQSAAHQPPSQKLYWEGTENLQTLLPPALVTAPALMGQAKVDWALGRLCFRHRCALRHLLPPSPGRWLPVS